LIIRWGGLSAFIRAYRRQKNLALVNPSPTVAETAHQMQ
jgi:hypothetical protein